MKELYLLVTPEKNEGLFLQRIADSIIKQSLKPTLWLIIDDGSNDSSPDIIKDLMENYDWIISTRLSFHPRDLTFHYSYVCKMGFEFAFNHCSRHDIQFRYIGLLDADTLVDKTYFEKLIHEFERDAKLGIASGCIIDDADDYPHLLENEWVKIPSKSPNKDSPRGTGRLWRKDCFIETGGYAIEPSPDTISNIKASARGWKIAQFDHIRAIQLRPTSSAEGVWKGYLINGEMAHYLNKPFILVLGGAVYFSLNRPYFQGLPYLLGYISAFLHRKPKIEDKDVKEFWKKRVMSIIHR